MSIAVDFYTFSKKINSTAIPTSGKISYNCNIIEPCSITNPVIAIVGSNNQFTPAMFNYARIEVFGRYYFVNDWVYDGGRWVAKLNVDTLASFWSYIANQDQYYSRCSVEWNGNIEDALYPCSTKTSIEYKKATPDIDRISLRDGTFLVQTVGYVEGLSSFKAPTSFYLMSGNSFERFANAMFSTEFWTQALNGIFKLDDYIISIKWLGLELNEDDYSSVGVPVTKIRLGKWDTTLEDGYKAYLIDTRFKSRLSYTFTFSNIPQHSKKTEYGNYMNTAPWAEYELIYFPIGKIQFDGKFFTQDTTAYLDLQIDALGGDSIYTFYKGYVNNSNIVETGFFSPWVDLPISSSTANTQALGDSIVSGLKTVAAFALTKNAGATAKAGAIAQGFETVGTVATVAAPNSSQRGSQGSIICSTQTPYIRCLFTDSVTHDRNSHGSPCCKVLKLATLSPGIFAVAQDPHYEIPCTDAELEQVYNITGGGFFYE